jgi:hypothetical protein|tara:strand:- start:834 stop:1130 length:297 start_codon:yes stop_codon:yes gene_type:complete
MYITVKYLGPTNRRGSRYKATIDQGGGFKNQATVSYDYALNTDGNAAEAVRALVVKADLNKYGTWNSFIMSYGPHGFIAIPSGLGDQDKTYLLTEEAA